MAAEMTRATDDNSGEGNLVPEGRGPQQNAMFPRSVRGDVAPVCILSGNGPRQRSYDLTGWRLILRGTDPDFNMQRSYRNLDNPFQGWNVRFISSTVFEAAWIRTDDAQSDIVIHYVSGVYRWVPNRHTRNGSLELIVHEGLGTSASEYGRVLAMTINGDDPVATSSWGPIYALFDPARFPSPGSLLEIATLEQTLRPQYNQDLYVDATRKKATPATNLWTVGATTETLDFVQSLKT